MLETTPEQIAVYTDEGRDDSAAGVKVVAGPSGALQVLVEASTSPICTIAIRWRGPIGTGVRILGDDWERGYGTLEWRGVVPERALPWYALLHEPGRGLTRGVGVETGAASLASWRVDETGVTLVLDVRCGGLGVRLGERRLNAATVHELLSRPGETPFAFARRFCGLLCPNPRLPVQPVYGGNDWYSRYGNITAETVRSDAAVIRELSPSGDNLPSYVIDAGWYPSDEHEAGLFDRGNAGFPDMPGLASQLQSSGITPGIWMRPLQTMKDAPQSWRVGPEHPLANVPGVYLDPSVPEVLEHVRKDIARIVDWGYRVIKHDFSTYDILGRWGRDMGLAMTLGVTSSGWAFADRTRTTAEIITGLYSTIREAAGEAQIIGCNTIGHLAAGHFEMQRTGDDTSGYRWERTRIMGVNTVAFRMSQHGTFFCADADCVGLRSEIPWEYNRDWLELLARSGTALFVSAHPDATGPEQRAALKAAFALASQPMELAEPLDWMESTCPRVWRFGGEKGETKTYDWHPFPGSSFACPP